MVNPFEYVLEFERQVAEYAGAPYGIATDCCSHAIFLSAMYYKLKHGVPEKVTLPTHTYVSAAMQLRHAGYNITFEDFEWEGAYTIKPTNIVDAAPRFTKGMYVPGTYHCVSFQYKKILSTIKGGMILTDDEEFYKWAQRATHDGRDMSLPYEQDTITMLGYHMFMTPETALMGLEKMKTIPDFNKDIAGSYTYPDISYTKGLN